MNANTKNRIHAALKPVAASVILLSLIACSPSAENEAETNKVSSSNEVKSDFPHEFEKIANNTWVMHGPMELPNPENKGFMNNPGVVKTSAGLVVIDPGSTLQVGENVLKKIKKISDDDIVAVFNTHIHGDHWLANQAIKNAYPQVKIYGHPQMLTAIENGEGEHWVNLMHSMTEGASEGTTVVAPNNSVDGDDIIKIGDTQFKIHHYGVAHTKTDIMIEVVENGVVFLGDNVLALRLPITADGTFQGTISSIESMLKSDAKMWVPGHGISSDRSMVKDYLNYLTLVYSAAQKAFHDDLDSSDVLAISRETTAAYKHWQGYDDLLGPHGAQAFSEVEASEF